MTKREPPTLTAFQVSKMITKLMLERTLRTEKVDEKKEIENVAFLSLLILWCEMQAVLPEKVRLYLPGEFCNEGLLIVYTPVPGFAISIESEPCTDYLWKIRTEPRKHNLN